MTRPKWNGKRIDKEIGIMSARSAQRTRWRRWRMGRDIAGRKDRDGRMSGLAGTSCCEWRRGSASFSFFYELLEAATRRPLPITVRPAAARARRGLPPLRLPAAALARCAAPRPHGRLQIGRSWRSLSDLELSKRALRVSPSKPRHCIRGSGL